MTTRSRRPAGVASGAESGRKPRRKAGASRPDKLSTLGAEMVAGADELIKSLKAGEPPEKRFTVRTLKLDLRVTPMVADDVKPIGDAMGASQAIPAAFLGVSPTTVRGWEQGSRPVTMIASRFLEEIEADPGIWRRRIVVTKMGPTG